MKKQLLALALLTGLYTTSHAQAVLSATDLNPAIYDAFEIHTCDTTGVTAMSGGANVTWDYSTVLHAITHDTVVSIGTTGCPHIALFPGTTIASKTLAANPTYNYYIHSSTSFAQNGYYQDSTQQAQFTDPMDQLHYPVHYRDSFNDAYTGTLFVSYLGSPFSGHQYGTVHSVVDGWGTLKLPGGVIDTGVLRVHSAQNFTDSMYVISTMVGAGFTINTYTWYMAGYHNGLLIITYLDQVSGPPVTTSGPLHQRTVAYATKYTHLSVEGVSGIGNSLEIFPNPASHELNITFENLGNENARVTLVDVMGREIAEISNKATAGNQIISYNTSSLPRGLYLVRVQTGAEVVTRKVTLQ